MRTSDSGIRTAGYTAQRVITHSADAAGLQGGELTVCSEYGRVEIVDSDDDTVRLQIRVEAFGEGAADPAAAARRAIEETVVNAHVRADQGRLLVSVWHSTLGFTPSAQPAFFSVRLQVPPRGAFRVRAEASHGVLAIRRLTIAGGSLRGRVGDKFKGIPGFIGGTELDNVTLVGDIEVSNEREELGAPIQAKVRVAAICRMIASTWGPIHIAVQPEPTLGVRAFAGSESGAVRVIIDGGVRREASPRQFAAQEQMESAGYTDKPLRLDVRAISGKGDVYVASVPSALLRTP